jgi:SAM-dependent methyltransferase
MNVEADRDDFGVRQAQMTARWFENVKRTHGDVEAYIATRHMAYLARWKEAARFIPDDANILDIGGGNIYPALVSFFKERRFRYNYLDVDPSCVDASRNLAQSLDLRHSTFRHGYNDALSFADCSFEAIFSSHCLEHSIDLDKTFTEVNRVLAEKGNLLMAVPFGWEENPEHPYFFGPQEWITLVTDAGFRVRVAQIGCEYPEQGYDYFIAAQKESEAGRRRLNPGDYTKTSFDFVSCFDDCIDYIGAASSRADHVIMTDSDWTIEIAVPPGVTEVLPILNRHSWSGIAEVSWGDQIVFEDLYSWFPYTQPLRIKNSGSTAAGPVKIRSRGKNPSSHSSQGVLCGLLVR